MPLFAYLPTILQISSSEVGYALPTNNRLGKKGQYSSLFVRSNIDEENSLIMLTPGVSVIKLFSFVTDDKAQ
jgi:hypothetical protein